MLTALACAFLATSGSRFWLQATTFMPNARPISATRRPWWPRPTTPSRLPSRPVPTVRCQLPPKPSAAPPARPACFSRWSSSGMCRSSARIRPQVSSAVDEPMPPVPHTVTPRAAAASRSIDALPMPVVTSSRSRGSWPSRVRVEGRAFPHRHDHVVRFQGADQRLRPSDVLGEHVDLAERTHRRPVRAGQGNLLIVIEDRDPHEADTTRVRRRLRSPDSVASEEAQLTWLDALTEKALARELPTRAEALNVLQSTDDELMDVVAAAFKVRLRYFGRRVKLNYLVNIKSGLCPEDCFYCSQRLGSAADVLKYTWLKPDEVISNAEAGVKAGAKRVCLVASGRGPTDADVTRVSGAIGKFKEQHPDVEVCACLGLLSDGQAERLHQAGTTAYNHNLNTAEANYADICTTHSYQDRADTVNKAKAAGLSPCSGLIAGMGETDDELVDVVFALRELDPDSVPVNFLIPFEGTPLGGQWALTPQRCLRILAMVRFTCPDAEVRLAGGREIHLRSLQPLALHIVNSIFLGDYLTSEGQAGARDLEMIADAGFTVEGAAERTLPEHRRDLVRVRRRGPGTSLPANA